MSAPLDASAELTPDPWPVEHVGTPERPAPPGPQRGRPFGTLRVLSVADAAQAPPRRHLLRGLIGEGELVLLYGAPKCGKSFLALRLAFGLARGVGFGDRDAVQPVRALYVAAEGEGGFGARVLALRDELGDPGDAFHYIAQRVMVGPPSTDLEHLIAAARFLGTNLVVIDTVARTFGEGDENAARDMGLYVAALDKLRDEARDDGQPFPAVVLIHHGPKDGQSSRGSIALPAAADAIIKVEKLPAGGNLATVEAAKDDADGTTLAFRLRTVELSRHDDGTTRLTCVAEPESAPAAERCGGTANLSPQNRRAFEFLLDVISTDAGDDLPPGPNFPRNVRGCRIDAWRAECDARGLAASDDPDTRARVFRRCRIALAQARIIAERDPWVWPVRDA